MELGAVDGAAFADLAAFARPPVRNVAGRVVGVVEAVRVRADDTVGSAEASS
jgi:hypothetical protein